MRIVVVGVGNIWASDDRVGIEVVNRLKAIFATLSSDSKQEATQPKAVTFITVEQATIELLDLMAECDQLMVVDAVVSGAPPGTLHEELWQPDRLAPRGSERISSHGFGVREILELACALERLPAQVQLWGIEVASTNPGLRLSPAVDAALPTIVERLKEALSK